ncbi:MAG TPA: PAS domain S-box protein [Dehalococcoidia bacterium]|nr:PAS domain S-box protein [Dehalococcoidia bacterium]
MSEGINKQQIRELLTTIARVSRGDYETRMETSGKHTEFDSVAAGLNMMINEIRSRQEDLEEQKEEINALNENLIKEIRERTEVESLYKTLTENSTTGVYIVQKGKFVFFNEVFRMNSGYPTDELLGTNSLDLIHPEDREYVRQCATDMLKGRRIQPYEFRLINKSGNILWSWEKVTSITYNGERAAMGNFIDITERKKTEETLSLSDAILKSIHESVIGMDAEFNITYWNDICESTFGITAKEAKGKFIGDLLQMEEEYEGQNDERLKILLEKGYNNEEQLYITPKGKVWVDVHVRAIEQDGERMGWVTLASDISERKKMEKAIRENEERFSTIFYDNPLPMSIFSPTTREVVDVNSAFAFQSGLSPEECREKPIDDLTTFVDPEKRDEITREMYDNGRVDGFEAQILLTSGEMKTMLLSSRLITLSGEEYFVTASNDITEQKRIEEQIQKTNKQLDKQNEKLHIQADQLIQQQQELVEKNREIERANQMKSEFLASMSHELRTPLNAVIGFSELMLDGITGDINDEQRECLNDILNSGQHLLELINDVLDLSKVEVGKMEFKPVELDVSDVINEAVQTVKSLLDQKEHSVNVNVEEGISRIYADKSRLRQVLLNLLSNATKFTHKGGKLEVTAATKNGRCLIGVKDNGIGIKKEDQEKIFEVFTQAETMEDETPKGTGLGLTLTRQFLAAMDGEIWVESEYGKGSTFFFTIPFTGDLETDSESVEEIPTEKVGQRPLSRQKEELVLIIDDDSVTRRLFSTWLTEEGYSIAEASNADEGLKQAGVLLPDIIILDILMPDKDGWYVLKELKSKVKTSNIPVVITSFGEEREMAFSLGAIDYFNKPINKKRFQKRISEIGLQRHDRVLVVDDNPADLHLVSSILETEGITSISADGGQEGINIILREKPSLIVLDLMMPDLSGFEVIEKLRETEGVKDIPIIIMTSKDLSNEELSYLRYQTEGVVKKGTFSREDLLSTINKLRKSEVV